MKVLEKSARKHEDADVRRLPWQRCGLDCFKNTGAVSLRFQPSKRLIGGLPQLDHRIAGSGNTVSIGDTKFDANAFACCRPYSPDWDCLVRTKIEETDLLFANLSVSWVVLFKGCRAPPSEYDVEAIAQKPIRVRSVTSQKLRPGVNAPVRRKSLE